MDSVRSIIQWAGGKKRVLGSIKKYLPTGAKRLIEPFLGGGSVFLNLDFEKYLLVDINKDLINLFNIIKNQPDNFINHANVLFSSENNNYHYYNKIRNDFNATDNEYYRSLLFLYLNRHGYNGLCRYNKSGNYNVPFGKNDKVYFPKKELEYFYNRAKTAIFIQGDFEDAFSQAEIGDVIYCDPPYSTLSDTANFTEYSGNTFTLNDHIRLVNCAEIVKEKGISTLISNQYTDSTKELYKNADEIFYLHVQRAIGCKGRPKVVEIMALYTAPKK